MTGGKVGAPLDDAWIHYQFARNLSQGNGFSYIPGVPTSGSTSPAWTLLLAGVGLFTQQYVWPSLFLSALFLLATVCLTFWLTLDVTADQLTAVMAALGVLFTGRMLWAGLSAMEVTLFAALSLAAVLAYRRWGLGWVTAVLFSLAALARPEGHLLFAFAVLETLLDTLNPLAGLRCNWRKLAAAFLLYALIQLPYVLFSFSVTGRPLPNTFYAKSNVAAGYSWRERNAAFSLARQFHFSAFTAIWSVLYLDAPSSDRRVVGGADGIDPLHHSLYLASRPLHLTPCPLSNDFGRCRHSLAGKKTAGQPTAHICRLFCWLPVGRSHPSAPLGSYVGQQRPRNSRN
ncbi:MAG: hypothetical protein ACE5EY_13055 [Anaerolineae bacterium]